MAALACGFSKPGNLLLGVNPAGVTNPMRELSGNTGSAAYAGAASPKAASRPNAVFRTVRDNECINAPPAKTRRAGGPTYRVATWATMRPAARSFDRHALALA